ncbi:unnamed protein product [Tuber aestivum]|uniref:EamA domain-containing protein n=1 Tax=Tuber aestivum TaxID=59557 RepID=A0A292Q294_9PEZI|nr:unnamed protein product [Tuber aestivum]
MPRRAVISLLVTGMLVTGVANTLLTKYQDMQCVRNCEDPDISKRRVFEQPVMQTLQMFIGEMGCWLIIGLFSIKQCIRNRQRKSAGYEPVGAGDDATAGPADGTSSPSPAIKPLVASLDGRIPISGFRIFLLAIPACCDIAGTTLMNVGLLFVAASIYQMTRGALVLFVGLFSVLFLKRHLRGYHWFALFVVVIGVGIVGLAGVLWKEEQPVKGDHILVTSTPDVPIAVKTIIGVLLIAGAQIFTATQFVVEEYILEHYALEPLKVVGWEGIFGFLVTAIGMVILHYTIGQTPKGQYGYFDAVEGFREITQYREVALTSIAIMVSIGGFNYFGISVTRSISATARSIIDTCRTLFIWMVSLALHWESFKWLQIIGFSLLVYGTFLFNELTPPPFIFCLSTRYNRRELRREQQERERARQALLPGATD